MANLIGSAHCRGCVAWTAMGRDAPLRKRFAPTSSKCPSTFPAPRRGLSTGLMAVNEEGDRGTEQRELADAVDKDFWEGSNWELLGKAASITIPTLVVMALLVGIFAAKFYNSGANTFLEMPKGPDDTAKLYQRAPE
ncbi:hypothetical protein ACKKBF_B35240 [Auxenochlorella protothecoides x Auxenochlorella symbiontica]|uniref:Uncharacterized protein n=2 Tax=Auxenochlorella protothecoides TaxID=3075 RepID=A0A1D2ADN4_AUXPR